MNMKSQTETMRALDYVVATAVDKSLKHPDKEEHARNQAFTDLMIPIVKGWFTETGIEVASTGIQVHGGMGFVEETGAAQHLRDSRITTIYEGTTGIQANDLIGRKTARDGGAAARAVVAEIRKVALELTSNADASLHPIGAALGESADALSRAIDWMVPAYGEKPRDAHAVAVPYLRLWGIVVGAWQLGRAALVAARHLREGTGDARFLRAKLVTARFYADNLLPQAPALARSVVHGGESALALSAEQF